MTLPGRSWVMGSVEYASVGADMGTVPGADHETVTSVGGSAPQLSRKPSGAVPVGNATAVRGRPSGGVRPQEAGRAWRETTPSTSSRAGAALRTQQAVPSRW